MEGFEASSEFSQPVVSVVFLVLFRLLGGFALVLRCLGIPSVFGETEFGFHDEPEDGKHDSEDEL